MSDVKFFSLSLWHICNGFGDLNMCGEVSVYLSINTAFTPPVGSDPDLQILRRMEKKNKLAAALLPSGL